MDLPASIEAIVRRLGEAGLRVYVVGGALRDLILARETRDFDLFVDAELAAAARVLPEARWIDASALPVLLLPAREGRARVEISAARPGATTLADDLRRRDFTINALAFEPKTGEWLDPLGGREDLAARVLRATDVTRAFVDDPIRVLRGVRLAAEIPLRIEPGTWDGMSRQAWRLSTAPGERLRDELFRMLALPDATSALERLHACGALAAVLPETLRGAGIEVAPEGGDVMHRDRRHAARLRPDPLLRLAALLHGAASPEVRRWLARARRYVLIRPRLRAARHVRAVGRRLRLSRRETAHVEAMIRLSDTRGLDDEASIRRMIERVGSERLEDVLDFIRAGEPEPPWNGLEARIRALAARRGDALAGGLAIGGKEIMQELGIPEGPEVRRLLARARRRAVERPAENTPARLLAWLRESLADGRA